MSSTGGAAVIRRVLSPAQPSNRALRFGLGGLALLVSVASLGDLIRGYPWGVDLEIALRAAERWMAGGQPYVAGAFAAGPGYDVPFLYPPYALPLFAPLTPLDRGLVQGLWFAAGVAIVYATCRRLGIQRRWIPALFVWPPFAEGLISGNVQIVIFAAFVGLLVADGRASGGPGDARLRPAMVRGLLIAATTFLKVSQPHVMVHLARWDRRAVIVAVAAIAALVIGSLVVMGTAIWMDWIDQLRRAADPGWALAGPSLTRLLPAPLGLLIVGGCLVAVLAVPRATAAAWVGILMVIGATSLHTYYLLFLLPAMLRIRLEIALVAALLVATYTEPAWWIAIAMVAGALALSGRQPGLLERPDEPQGREARTIEPVPEA